MLLRNKKMDYIYHELQNLGITQIKELSKDLSFQERALVLKLLKSNGYENIRNEQLDQLKQKIETSKSKKIPVVLKSYTINYFTILSKSISSFFNEIAYHFNIITANKLNNLIKNNFCKIKSTDSDKGLKYATSENLIQIIQENSLNRTENKPIQLKELLEKNGFSKHLKNIQLDSSINFNDVKFENLKFENCHFNWTQCNHSSFKNVSFLNCEMNNMAFMDTVFDHCSFQYSEIRECMFTGTKILDTTFLNNDIISSSFEDATISNTLFKSVFMPGTHFLQAEINHCFIRSSHLSDTIFFGLSDAFNMDESSKASLKITKPLSSILIHPENRGISNPKAYQKLSLSTESIPIRITMVPRNIDSMELTKELDELFLVIQNHKTEKPIPQELISEVMNHPSIYPNFAKILNKAEQITKEVDSIFLPGGEDIPPKLYGSPEEKETNWGNDYRRSILELGLIHQSFQKGIPLMAICRGFQMTNVYCGAHLVQHIEGQMSLQKLKLTSLASGSFYQSVVKNSMIGISVHHQGILEKDYSPEKIEASIVYDGIIKASESKVGAQNPTILLQFHPEFYQSKTADSFIQTITDEGVDLLLSEENESFFKLLKESSDTHRNKKNVLDEIKKKNLDQ